MPSDHGIGSAAKKWNESWVQSRGLGRRTFVEGTGLICAHGEAYILHSVEREPDLVMRASIAIYAVKIWTARICLHVEISYHFIATTLTC